MNFVSPQFLFFLLAFLVIRWVIFPIFVSRFLGNTSEHNPLAPSIAEKTTNQSLLILILLLGSYLFYASWNYKFLGLILFTSVSDFLIGKEIYKSNEISRRKCFLFLSIFLNLSILGFYKYSSFFLQNIFSMGNVLGFSFSPISWNVLLPAGISFYTFQSISYTVDVYRKILPAEQNFFRYALFLAFFPQLVAGPIVMAREFLPQILNAYRQKFSEISLNKAFYFILLGFVKKSVIADNISVITDLVFSNPEQIKVLSWSYIAMGMVAYSIQIYGDFSGYTDIARGVALLFGFSLPENFNLPYFASSIPNFWQRWHISLSSWLRSYLYIPLGGNRNGLLFTYRNLFLTMLLGGLWHGANWNFLIWGGLHGVYLGLERFFSNKWNLTVLFSDVRPFYKLLIKVFYSGYTFILVTCFWVFFRASNLSIVKSLFWGVLELQEGIKPNYAIEQKFYSIAMIVFLGHCIGFFYKDKIQEKLKETNRSWQFGLYAFLTILAVIYSGELKPFIYFVF